MDSKCDCGRMVSRGHSYFRDGKVVRTCPDCAPAEFQEFLNPADAKVYYGPEVHPTLYKRGEDDVYRAKDELLQDTVDLMNTPHDSEAIERKRRERRTRPMSADEIQNAVQWSEKVLATPYRQSQMEAE